MNKKELEERIEELEAEKKELQDENSELRAQVEDTDYCLNQIDNALHKIREGKLCGASGKWKRIRGLDIDEAIQEISEHNIKQYGLVDTYQTADTLIETLDSLKRVEQRNNNQN